MRIVIDLVVVINGLLGIGAWVGRRLYISRRARHLLDVEQMEKELKIK